CADYRSISCDSNFCRMKHHRTAYWTKERVLARMKRAVREVYENDPSRLSTKGSRWNKDIAPFNARSHNQPLYPSSVTISRSCGGLQSAWKDLGFEVSTVALDHVTDSEIEGRVKNFHDAPRLPNPPRGLNRDTFVTRPAARRDPKTGRVLPQGGVIVKKMS